MLPTLYHRFNFTSSVPDRPAHFLGEGSTELIFVFEYGGKEVSYESLSSFKGVGIAEGFESCLSFLGESGDGAVGQGRAGCEGGICDWGDGGECGYSGMGRGEHCVFLPKNG